MMTKPRRLSESVCGPSQKPMMPGAPKQQAPYPLLKRGKMMVVYPWPGAQTASAIRQSDGASPSKPITDRTEVYAP